MPPHIWRWQWTREMPMWWRLARARSALCENVIPDLAIISLHEKGFWQADLYLGAGSMTSSEFEAISPSPDDFITMARGEPAEACIATAKEQWPDAVVVEANSEEETGA
jgi:hypothetical protein